MQIENYNTGQLRRYQSLAVAEVSEKLNAGRAVLLVSPTGAGKTIIAAGIAKQYKRVLLVAHRQEIIDQAHAVMGEHVVAMSILAALRYGPTEIDLLIIDEAHRSAAKTYRDLIEKYRTARRLGLTATALRADGQGLCDAFEEIVLASSIPELVAEGYLVPYRALEAPDEALNKLAHMKRSYGDYATRELSQLMNQPRLVGDVVREYVKHAAGRKAVVFAVSVEHSIKLAGAFLDAGIRAVHIDGRASAELRKESLQSVADGRVDVLCNVNLFTEGWDCPAISCVVMARPTASVTLYLQSVGRGMRPSPDKSDLLILDHAGNIERHGAPDGLREWSLESKERRAAAMRDIAELERIHALGYESIEAELEEKRRVLAETYSALDCARLVTALTGMAGHKSFLAIRGIQPLNGEGWAARYPRREVDSLLESFRQSYSTSEALAVMGMVQATAMEVVFQRHGITPVISSEGGTKGRRGWQRWNKADVDRLAGVDRQADNQIEPRYYSREEVAAKIIPVFGISNNPKGISRFLKKHGIDSAGRTSDAAFFRSDIDRLIKTRTESYSAEECRRMLGIHKQGFQRLRQEHGIRASLGAAPFIFYKKVDIDPLVSKQRRSAISH